MQYPIRILYINGGLMDNGGISSYMMNYYRNIDSNRIQIDFIVHGYKKGVHDAEIEHHGGKIYHVPVKSKNPLGNYTAIMKIMKTGNYKIVHSHMDAMNYVPLKIAEMCGVPVRISHSHNTQYLTQNPVKILANGFSRMRIPKVATHLFACSKDAGEWLYGSGCLNRIEIIHNAIDIDKFKFIPEFRNQIRANLNINDKDIVIGHVGKFEYQKNQEYLINIFAKLYDKSELYKLVLIGDGSLKETMRQMCIDKNIIEHVIFIDSIKEVWKYYNIFDLYCFPSRFEGLGFTLIEAQTNGLKCLASDSVPIEADITGNVMFIPVDFNSSDVWIDNISKLDKSRDVNGIYKIIKAGYSIKEAAMKLEERYECLAGTYS